MRSPVASALSVLLLTSTLAVSQTQAASANRLLRTDAGDRFQGFAFFEDIKKPVLDIFRPFLQCKTKLMAWDDDGGDNPHAQRQTWVPHQHRFLVESFMLNDPQTDPRRRPELQKSIMDLHLASHEVDALRAAFGIPDILPLLVLQASRHSVSFEHHVDRPHGAGLGEVLTTVVFEGVAKLELASMYDREFESRFTCQLLPKQGYKLEGRARFTCSHAIELLKGPRVAFTLRWGISPAILAHLCTNVMAACSWMGTGDDVHQDCGHRRSCRVCHGVKWLPPWM